MGDLNFSWQNVIDGNGIAISIVGMAIVFLSLSLISAFIALLPKVLQALEGYLPPERETHEAAPAQPQQEDEVLAAIGFVLHQRRGQLR